MIKINNESKHKKFCISSNDKKWFLDKNQSFVEIENGFSEFYIQPYFAKNSFLNALASFFYFIFYFIFVLFQMTDVEDAKELDNNIKINVKAHCTINKDEKQTDIVIKDYKNNFFITGNLQMVNHKIHLYTIYYPLIVFIPLIIFLIFVFLIVLIHSPFIWGKIFASLCLLGTLILGFLGIKKLLNKCKKLSLLWKNFYKTKENCIKN